MICPTGGRSRCKEALISSGEGKEAERDKKSRSAECLTLSWYKPSVAPPKRTNASGKARKIVTAARSINVLTSARARVNPLLRRNLPCDVHEPRLYHLPVYRRL